MTDLRTIIEQQSANHTVVVPTGTYEIPDTLRTRGRTLLGNVNNPSLVRVHVLGRRDPHSPAIVQRGTGDRLLGMTFYGDRPDGHKFDPDRYAQHAVEWEGAVGPEIAHCVFRNIWGDIVYVNKSDSGDWTHNGYLHHLLTDQVGRHFLTPNAADHIRIGQCVIGECSLGIVDVEPPGGNWGATYLNWSDTDIYDTGGGFVFANKGGGKGNNVHDIILDHVRCLKRAFSATINPTDPDIHRYNYLFRECGGIGYAEAPALTARGAYNVAVVAMHQKMDATDPVVWQKDCINITLDGVPVKSAS